jgi:hypothetical protein
MAYQFRLTVAILLLAPLASMLPVVCRAEVPILFSIDPKAPRMQAIGSDANAAVKIFPRIAFDLNKNALQANRLKVQTPDGRSVEFTKAAGDTHRDHWSGVQGSNSDISLSRMDAGYVGLLHTKDRVYSIKPGIGGQHILTEHRIENPLPDHKLAPRYQGNSIPMPQDMEAAGFANAQAVTPDLRILVVVTPSTLAYWGSPMAAAISAVNSMNAELSASNLSFQATVAAATYLPVEPPDSTSGAIQLIKSNIDIISLRNQSNSDIVVLIGRFSEWCGEANATLAVPHTGFAVVDNNCMITQRSFTHEIGHLFGARHDRSVENIDVPYNYGHGYWLHYYDNECLHTIMAYPVRTTRPDLVCNHDPRINRFSSPDDVGSPDSDNTRVMRQNIAYVAGFRNTKLSAWPSNPADPSGSVPAKAAKTLAIIFQFLIN